MKATFFSYSFGCRVNEAEKQVLDKKLIDRGFLWSETHPDFYIINSCAVTGKAEREVRQHIYQTRKKFPHTKIIVTGCAATHWIKNKIAVAGVDMRIKNNEKQHIPTIIHDLLCHSCERRNLPKMPDQVRHDNINDKFLGSGRLMVKIQDGCDKFCSYCIVPSVRGTPQSRFIYDIVKEINTYDKRATEVILTAINTACFGKDTGETLIQLIDSILTQTTIPKISFGSIHPWSVTDEFISYYQSILPTNRFVSFFHIPIQSGSNKILKAMNRGYTKEEIYRKLKELKGINPEAFIGTDIIVGFPGETEKEFQETFTFLQKAPIDKIHVFRYSKRPGTPAEKFLHEPRPQEKRERSQLLIKMKNDGRL